MITAVKIYPSIGIARLGNSPDFFVGPEVPGDRTPPAGGYKDASCRVRRQAARFRIFGFDAMGGLVQEVTAADAKIVWTVHLANKKASYKVFDGTHDNPTLRNAGISDRGSLEIDPGPRTLDGPGQAAGFNTGHFLGVEVPLGEMQTDGGGRLLVLGGFGNSGSVPPGQPVGSGAFNAFANNDLWHDDVSDGPVTATVTLNGTAVALDAAPAWVICAPPDFAPPVDSVTTLYDALFERSGLPAPVKPSFQADIFPILRRVVGLTRVSQLAAANHGNFDFATAAALPQSVRQGIVARLRNPAAPEAAGPADMPRLWGDNEGADQTVTKTQYGILAQWASGDYLDDSGDPPPVSPGITPDGLTRAALEACVGGAMFPGIEGSWLLRDDYAFSEPFRLDPTGRAAGDITRQMAVPWQSDFWKCQDYGGLAWWPAQRPDDVFPEAGGGPVPWTRDLVASHLDMVDAWSKLGFVVDQGGQLVETERHVICPNLFLVTDKNEFAADEVTALLGGGSPASFPASLFVVADAFLPDELGVTDPHPSPLDLAPIAPAVTFRRPDATAVPDLVATPQKLHLEDETLPALQRQRFTFEYSLDFASADGFSIGGMPVETQMIEVTATRHAIGRDFQAGGTLLLTQQPSPYLLDGAVSWLSTDVRVFQVTDGGSAFGIGLAGGDETAALDFLGKVLAAFAAHGHAGHPFDGIPTDEEQAALELASKVNGQAVFNYAVARVRYRATALPAKGVHVFFRMFTTAATGTDYNPASTYRRTPSTTDPVPLLGLQGGEIVTFPFFATPRVDTGVKAMSAQPPDGPNIQELDPAGADERWAFFGCWLDFNQETQRFPIHPVPDDGPWDPSSLLSIQDHIRGLHQCLVAEIFFKEDLIPPGATPANDDRLSQRNLAIVPSDNPGSLASHTVQHTLEIKASGAPGLVGVARERLAWEAGSRSPGAVGAALAAAAPAAGPLPPDELMILWGGLPRSTRMTLYMPDVDADEVLRLAGARYEAKRLERVDGHTLRCLPADVTYLPLPGGRTRNIPALLTLELPDGVRRGQLFRLLVHQVSGRPRRVLGTVQMTIPVSDKGALLAPEIRHLSVLRHIALSIPQEDPWRAVFGRYLEQIAGRVRGFGGDPDRVLPAADGSGRNPAAERCARRGGLFAALVALLIAAAGLHPLPDYLAELAAAAAALLALFGWRRRCRPSRCRQLAAALVGLGSGAAVVGLLRLLGLVGGRAGLALSWAAIAAALLLLAAWRLGCFRETPP